MASKSDVVSWLIIIAVILFLLFANFHVPTSGINPPPPPPMGGSYWTLNLSTNAGDFSVTNIPVGVHNYALNESVFVRVTTLKVQQNPAYPEEAWLQWIRWRLNGNYQAYGAQNITVGPAGNHTTITLEAIYSAVLAVFFPNATFARGQTYTVSLKFVNQYEGFHNAQIELSTDPYGRAVFTTAAIGTDYALGVATGFENCYGVLTPLGLKHISGTGSSDDYPLGSVSEWQVRVTVSTSATVGANDIMVAMGGTSDTVSGGLPAFNNYRWHVIVT